MSKILFENKKVALGFAGAIIVGAMVFSGVSGSPDDSSNRAQSRLAQPQQGEPAADQASAAQPEEDEAPGKELIDFAPDEELIDSTDGFDPSPAGSRGISDEEEEEPQDEDGDEESDPFGDFDDFDDDDDLSFNGEF